MTIRTQPQAQRLYIATYCKHIEKRIVGVYTTEAAALAAIKNDAGGFNLDEKWYGIEFARLDEDSWGENAIAYDDDAEGDDE